MMYKRPLEPRKSAQVDLQMKHLHGADTRSLRLHAQYFALFFILFLKLFIHKKERGFLKRIYTWIHVFVNTNIYII